MSDKREAYSRHVRAAVLTSAFTVALAGIGLLTIISPKQESSEMERRDLAQWPELSLDSLLSGSYTRGVENYFADHFLLREQFVHAASAFQENLGLRYDDVRVYQDPNSPVTVVPPSGDDNPGGSQTSPGGDGAPSSSSAGSQEDALAPAPLDETGDGEKRGSLFIYKNMALPIFGAGPTQGVRYAQILNEYQKALPGVTIYNCVIPSSISLYLPERYQSVTTDERVNIDNIYGALDPQIKAVSIMDTLLAHRDEYIYFRTDHHWTALGAYYAYVEFCKQAGFEPVPLEQMEKRTKEEFLGTLYSESQDSALAKTPDYVEYFIPPQSYTAQLYKRGQPFTPTEISLWGEYASGGNSYSVFLHGDHPLIVAKTGLNTGRKILVVKESFGNAFAPFLISHYDEVHVVDQRYFELGLVDYIQQNGITDLLFINNIFAANTGIRCQEIQGLMYQVYTPPAAPQPTPTPTPPAETSSSESTGRVEDGVDENGLLVNHW